METNSYFIEIPAFRVEQPLGDFYLVKINANDLLSISFSEPMQYIDEYGNVKGSQRKKDTKRLKEIAKYIDSVEMAFPNTIILAANYSPKGVISQNNSERWEIIEDKECGIYKIRIPKKIPLAAIIDGQHRLNAFEFVTKHERKSELQLVCSIYFDLPNSYQAFLFATINSNQKRVDRSLALEQFGYNVGEEEEKAWTPEKLGVFLSRKLNIDKEKSPLYKHIKVAPLNSEILFQDSHVNSWVVSTATIVDGITSLISNNVKRDRIEMQQVSLFKGRERSMLKDIRDESPLRDWFIEGKDKSIYDLITKYFAAVNKYLWKEGKISYATKTVGIQALFDILKLILKKSDVSFENIDFEKYLSNVENIDFSDRFFQTSGIGRYRIKNTIALKLELIEKTKINKRDLYTYEKLISNINMDASENEQFIWEEEAENAIINALESAEWNYKDKNVTLSLDGDEYDNNVYEDFNSFYSKLVEIAEENFSAYVPGDRETYEEFRKRFDADEIVQSHLIDYEENFKKLDWK